MSNDSHGGSGKEQPIIIKKIKKGGHGHHGGAWKVAYADFVTAMMAFFIVMWILASSQEVRDAVAEYYQHPENFSVFTGEKISGKVPVQIDLNMPSKPKKGDGESSELGTGPNNNQAPMQISFDKATTDTLFNMLQKKATDDSIKAAQRVEKMGKELLQKFSEMLSQKPELEKLLNSIKVEITKEGLRIELIESSESLFFEVGSANLKKAAIDIISKLAGEIGKLPNTVEIEGHTDSRGYKTATGYTNWELSADRANSARRILDKSGFWPGQVVRVTGFADQRLREPSNPFDVVNRRVSILIKELSTKDFLPDSKK